jgi:hypothetical protein
LKYDSYKQLDYVKHVLSKGFSNHIQLELNLVAEYEREQENENIKDWLIKYAEENVKGFNQVEHFQMINNAVNYAESEKHKLIQIDNIPIYEEELKYITKLNIDLKSKKLLFTLLVLDKLRKEAYTKRNGTPSKEYYFGTSDKIRNTYRDLINKSCLPSSKNKLKMVNHIIFELSKKKIVTPIHNGIVRLNFIYDIPEDDNVVLNIKYFDVIGRYYEAWSGEGNIKFCENCGKPFKQTNNKNKYCRECAFSIKQEQRRIADLKYKHRIRSVDKIENTQNP